MQGVVTAISSYNGAPAFEYEIRDDGGAVLAMDYVVVHPKDGETWDDLASLVQNTFLPKRVAKWALTPAEQRSQRREARLGGNRLSVNEKTASAPQVAAQTPSAKHLVSIALTPTQASAMRDIVFTAQQQRQMTADELARSTKAFRV